MEKIENIAILKWLLQCDRICPNHNEDFVKKYSSNIDLTPVQVISILDNLCAINLVSKKDFTGSPRDIIFHYTLLPKGKDIIRKWLKENPNKLDFME